MTYKENVPDIRNSRVVDVHAELVEHGINPLVHDPLASPEATLHEYGIELRDLEEFTALDALILAVDHRVYCAMELSTIVDRIRLGGLLIDIKSRIDPSLLRSDIVYWSL